MKKKPANNKINRLYDKIGGKKVNFENVLDIHV